MRARALGFKALRGGFWLRAPNLASNTLMVIRPRPASSFIPHKIQLSSRLDRPRSVAAGSTGATVRREAEGRGSHTAGQLTQRRPLRVFLGGWRTDCDGRRCARWLAGDQKSGGRWARRGTAGMADPSPSVGPALPEPEREPEPEPEREPEPKDTSRPEMPQQTGLRERKPLSPEALAELKAEEAAILAELAALEADEADADTAKTAKTALLAKRLHIVSSVHRPLAPTHACPVLREAYSCDSCG